MSIPRAVVFDLGKVLVDFDYRIAARRLEPQSTAPWQAILAVIYASPVQNRLEVGQITSEQFFQEVTQTIGFRGSFAEFKILFGDIFTPIDPMVALQSQCRSRGIPTFIFSNTNDLAVQWIRQQYPFFTGFNDYIYSYEHRSLKPDAVLYQVLEQRSGMSGADLLYLDDRPENVAAGARRGWQTILHESPPKTIAAIKQMGLVN